MNALSHTRPDSVIPSAMESPGTVLAVGIDIAKHTHVARAVRGTGIRVQEAFSCTSQPESLHALAAWIKALQLRLRCSHVFIGMEPTNVFWRPVYAYLVEHLPDCGVYIVPAINVHYARRMHGSNFSKTDPRDAFLIAEQVIQTHCSRPIQHTPVTRQVRDILHNYLRADHDATNWKHQLQAMLGNVFPEALAGVLPGAAEGRLAILRDTPAPADVRAVPEAQWVKDRLKSGRPRAMLHALYRAAVSSAARPVESPYWRDSWDSALLAWDGAVRYRTALHMLLGRILQEIPEVPLLQTVPGVDLLTAAAFFAGAGTLSQYNRAAQVEKVFGLDLHRWQSGIMDATPHITKRGYAPARRAFYLAALSARKLEPFNQWYSRHVPDKEQKGKRKYIVALAAKLVRICFSVARSGTVFDSFLAVEHE
jgi:transposase